MWKCLHILLPGVKVMSLVTLWILEEQLIFPDWLQSEVPTSINSHACLCASVRVCPKMTRLLAKVERWTAVSVLLGIINKVQSYAGARGSLLNYKKKVQFISCGISSQMTTLLVVQQPWQRSTTRKGVCVFACVCVYVCVSTCVYVCMCVFARNA